MRAMATQKQKRAPLDSPASDAAANALAVSLGERPLPAYEPTDEDRLLASAAHRAYPEILRRIEEEPAQLLKLGTS